MGIEKNFAVKNRKKKRKKNLEIQVTKLTEAYCLKSISPESVS